ncbi:polysaccharide deacetylase family protein [Pseudonocardia sp. TRM90224]|uniref:polysaccharide deacetylase family protein n=1 Tax=Pseudonocardia sp. TRM90224 TaxID=2812678 RepID=UPI001E5C2805|nr:polysaccharide deacetylase family protein [Pseudonocardia sp. TRM90224]
MEGYRAPGAWGATTRRQRATATPVLLYHGVHDDPEGPAERGHFHPVTSVRRDDFARQLDAISEAGYRTRRLDEVDGPAADKRIVLTFDDGDVSNVEVVLPMLVERGMVAEFFVVSDLIGTVGRVGPGDGAVLSAAGMGVQSHTRTHRPLTVLTPDELRDELVTSRQVLQQWAGSRVTAVSFPEGRGRQREHLAALRTGYTHVLGSLPGPNRRWEQGACLERIAITRQTSTEQFRALVTWSGVGPLRARLRYHTFEGVKRVLGKTA